MVADTFIMLLELLAHDKLTAKQLSERLEVSERTVYRYIDVLSASGQQGQGRRHLDRQRLPFDERALRQG